MRLDPHSHPHDARLLSFGLSNLIAIIHSALSRTTRLLTLLLLCSSVFYGYSVLTHEAVVDSAWDASIKKSLLQRYPSATPEELEHAHAYVYGGCLLQDLGYYPFGSHLFTDLTHYVRSGDFIVALIRDSQDINEFAFALGAMAHYAADNEGHPLATNLAVPMLYPKLRRKFGRVMTYWQDPLAHIRTEFGFDVLQVAEGRYAPDSYHAFIGFEVSKPLLQRAFRDTYGMDLTEIVGSLDLSLGTFRWGVTSFIPGLTKVAWRLRKETLIREIPGITKKKFLYNLSRSSYEKEWGTQYQRPGIGVRFVAWLLRVATKIGLFRSLVIRPPTPEVEKLFMASFNAAVGRYRALLAEVDADRLDLPNDNFDVGVITSAGQYPGTDLTYDELLDKLAKLKFVGVSAALRSDILGYEQNRKLTSPPTKKAVAQWEKMNQELSQLRQFEPASVPAQ